MEDEFANKATGQMVITNERVSLLNSENKTNRFKSFLIKRGAVAYHVISACALTWLCTNILLLVGSIPQAMYIAAD